VRLDEKDRQILACLGSDARASYSEVASTVGMSQSAVHERVRKLEEAGVIKGYRAEIDLEAVGLPITAIVSLALSPSSPDNIPALIAEFDLVESLYSIAGDNSYALIVRAPSTKDLESLVDALRSKLSVTTRTTIVLSTPFEGRSLP
jgi:Lrp/AsnC family transcriptional regulator, leucine-responsive regulatory protein